MSKTEESKLRKRRNDIFYPIGLKWGVEVLLLLEEGPSKYTPMTALLGKITDGTLSIILHRLQDQQLVIKTKDNEWDLSKKGRKALPFIKELYQLSQVSIEDKNI